MARAFGVYELGAPKKFTPEQTIKKEYQQRLQTNDIIKSDPIAWPHLDDGMLHSASKGSGC